MKRDNFHTLKKEVEQENVELAQKLSLWKRNNDSGLERQINDISKSILLNLKRIEESMNENEFPLQKSDISMRKDFIYDAKQKVNASIEQLKLGSNNNNTYDMQNMNKKGANAYADQKMLQKKIMDDQDVILDSFHDTVEDLSSLGSRIHITLEEQNSTLNKFNDDVANVNDRVITSNKKVDRLIEKANENKLWIMIVMLTVCLLAVTVISFAF